jgi:hypothetical protein
MYAYIHVGLYTYIRGGLWMIMAVYNELTEDMGTLILLQMTLTMEPSRLK